MLSAPHHGYPPSQYSGGYPPHTSAAPPAQAAAQQQQQPSASPAAQPPTNAVDSADAATPPMHQGMAFFSNTANLIIRIISVKIPKFLHGAIT